jgi:hypothetical protein
MRKKKMQKRFLLENAIGKIACGDQSNESSSHLERIGIRIDMTSFVLEQSSVTFSNGSLIKIKNTR